MENYKNQLLYSTNLSLENNGISGRKDTKHRLKPQ